MTSTSILIYFYIAFGCALAQLIPLKTQQVYKLKSQVNIQDYRPTPYTVGYEIETELKISSIWDLNNGESQFLHFQLDPIEKISTKISKNRNDIPNYKTQNTPEFKRLQYLDFYVYLEKGQIKKFFANKEDKNAFSLNFKRGLSSLFQVQTKNSKQLKTEETDSLGICSVSYAFASSAQFSKTKYSCRNWNLKVGQRYESALDVKRSSRQDIHYQLKQDFLYELDAIEIHSINLVSKNNVGSKIESHISLRLISSNTYQKSYNSLEEILNEHKNFQFYNIECDIDGRVSYIDSNLKTLLKTYKEEMDNLKIGKLSVAYIFAQLLPIARITKTEDFIQILKSKTMAESLNQIVDLLGATQTIDSHTAFMKVFQLENEDDFEIIERYLQALSLATRPQQEIFMDLYDHLILKSLEDHNVKLYDTLVQTLASIANKYSLISPNMFEDKIVVKMKDYILYKLNSCKDFSCKGVYIRGLQNLRDPSTIETLINIALENDRAASVQAMKALKTFDIKLFTNNHRKAFEKIFYQITKKFDSTARIAALDILLAMKPSKIELTQLIQYFGSNDNAFEVKRYSIEKLKLIISRCPKFNALVKAILKNRPDINNYHIIGQNGLSSVLKRDLSKDPAFNQSLISVQEIFNGILKQGDVDYILQANNNEISLFKLGLFTSGLSSFISSNDNNDVEETEEVKAGMEIAIQNVQLRPLIFFNGHSELMGHVWSGTASEPTTAYQATVIQQDHEEYILLQNGATLFLQIVGAKSIDLNGKIEFSLWNRNAHAEIIKNSGEAIYGTITYGTSFIKMKTEFSIESNPKINVNADVDFYSDIKLCIQLGKPKSTLRQQIGNTLGVVGYDKKETNSVVITTKLPGKTLALNQKNNDMCNIIG